MSKTKPFPAEALEAISKGVKDGHSVFCLEQLGVPQRLINLLYKNDVREIQHLVGRSPEQMLSIPKFGKLQLKIVLEALSKYHMIEDI